MATGPTLDGFQAFVTGVLGIQAPCLPSDTPVGPVTDAYEAALETVSLQLQVVSGAVYAQAVYWLAGSFLINLTPDQPGQTFFLDLRKTYGLGVFVPGVVASSGNSGTSESLATPEALKRLTLADLQRLKDPCGREYLAITQKLGPNLWGIT